jgi:hypothetical protein
VRQKITLQQGIPIEKAKEIVRLVKDSKKKAQASIQGDTVRISSKDRDELQSIIALLRAKIWAWNCSSRTTARTEIARADCLPVRSAARKSHSMVACSFERPCGFDEVLGLAKRTGEI